ncbi:regulatory protein ral2 [Ephemerocybe angulata]|uniref:Regulatory protein ral2 n=1 Tax=Ephemerocybe angulata TaxID=980116 RepID=A0A8H6I4W5_9AGAR|nr:regulatory protein ral2 [Tulosesus angulatus]
MLHSIYDLTTYCKKTGGDVPAKLVGASTTVVGSKMYLFGGRLVTERRMVSDLYVFDLETCIWDRINTSPDDDVPQPRYFHSADAWNDHLVIFGGMSNQPNSQNPEELCVLNDVRFYDLNTGHWVPEHSIPITTPEGMIPRARYAHLSSVTANRLFIIGGQDFFNTWLDDVCVYDLVTKTWVQRRDYPRHCGTYRSVAVSSPLVVRSPQDELQAGYSSSTLGPPGSRFQANKTQPPVAPSDVTPPQSIVHLPYSATPTEDHPSDIYLYSNYNFTDVKRELEVFSPLPEVDFTIQDRSSAMTGSTFPPGLRFPTGAILGSHLIIAGTYLAHSYQSYSIWVLDLSTMTWSRIDPGKALDHGSWFRGCIWSDANKFLIFGNKHGNLVDDYNRRLLSWDHVAVIDLEAFGIYQAPFPKLDMRMQELGLAALEEKVLTDFEIICEDGRRIPCSRKILEDRWPWFKEQRLGLLKTAAKSLNNLPHSPMHVGLPDVSGSMSFEEPRLDPRLTPRQMFVSEPYPIALALVQYLYSLALVTPLQHAPTVLNQLLVLSINYKLPHLESLVKHSMHRSLSNSTSVGVYEVATLCSCRSLQIRALKTVMSYTQKRPSRTARGGGSGGAGPGIGGGSSGLGTVPEANGHGQTGGSGHYRGGTSANGSGSGQSGGGGGGSLMSPIAGPSNYTSHAMEAYTARPRGTSDARWRTMGTGPLPSTSGYSSSEMSGRP